MSTIKAANIQNPSAASAAIVLDTSGNVNIDSNTLYVDGTNNRVGIGTTSPDVNLVVEAATGDATLRVHAAENNSGSEPILILESSNDFAESIIEFKDSSGTGGGIRYNHGDNALRFQTNGTSERARIDSSGRLLVGTSSAPTGTNSQYSKLVTQGNTFDGNGSARMAMRVGVAASSLSAGSTIGDIYFVDNGAGEYARIACDADAQAGSGDYPGRLVFSTTADGASSPTERARITNAGYFKATADGTYHTSAGLFHEFTATTSSSHTLLLRQSATGFSETGGGIFPIGCVRSATSAYTFAGWYSGDGTAHFNDREFHFRGDGAAFSDSGFNGGGADYAEYFEWSDFNPDEEDRRGISVVLDGNKIREAVDGEDPIGVISGNPSVVGDAAWNKWSGKYLRDEFGSYLLDAEGYRQLNPDFDPDAEYIPREQRPEWDCVGLMGKLRIRKGQVTGSRWIKMRDISNSVEEWLVR